MENYRGLTFHLLLLVSVSCIADTKWINGVQYGNVCRKGENYSVFFHPSYWKPVGSKCDLITLEGRLIGQGIISHE